MSSFLKQKNEIINYPPIFLFCDCVSSIYFGVASQAGEDFLVSKKAVKTTTIQNSDLLVWTLMT